MQKNEKKHEKWDCGSQVSLGEWTLPKSSKETDGVPVTGLPVGSRTV